MQYTVSWNHFAYSSLLTSLTAFSCATLASVRCRNTPITLFKVGSCELGTNSGTEGNITSGSMPPDFAFLLGGMAVLNPVCGRPTRWEHVPPLAERHRTALNARLRSNDHLNSTASTAAAAMNSTRENSPVGAPRASEDELPICNPTRRHYRTNYTTAWLSVIWHRLTASAGCYAEWYYRMKQ